MAKCPEIRDVSISADAYGVYNYGSDCSLNNVSIVTNMDGVVNAGSGQASGSIKMNYVTIDTVRSAFYCLNDATAEIDHSSLKGDSIAIRGDQSTCTTSIGDTKVEGGIYNSDVAVFNCVGVYDETYSSITCPPVVP